MAQAKHRSGFSIFYNPSRRLGSVLHVLSDKQRSYLLQPDCRCGESVRRYQLKTSGRHQGMKYRIQPSTSPISMNSAKTFKPYNKRSRGVSFATAPKITETRPAKTVITRKCLTVSSRQRYQRHRACLDS